MYMYIHICIHIYIYIYTYTYIRYAHFVLYINKYIHINI